MGCCCDSSVLSGGWSGGAGEGRRVSSGRVKSGGPSAVQTKIGAMVTKDTTVDSSPFVWTKESLARKGRYPFKKIVGAGVQPYLLRPLLGTSWFSLEKSGIG